MGGGFFDSIWDPYSGAYASYPRAQPRARYYRPRDPVFDRYGSSTVPEERSRTTVVEPVNPKTMRTIPVTDGGAPVAVPQNASVKPVVAARFKSEDAAASKIQAVYRGYVVRKTQPVKHLRVIKSVKEELESFKCKLQETEQKKKLCSDAKERLRWTEGVMSLLLRLDSLQGVHPEVRLVRKAVTKELLGLQETIDSMTSVVSGESNGQDDVIPGENSDSSDAISGENLVNCDAIVPEAAEEMEIGESTSEELSGEERDSESRGASEACENGSDGQGIKAIEDSTCEKPVDDHAPSAFDDQVTDSGAPDCDDENGLLSGLEGETTVEAGLVSEPRRSSEADAEVPMDIENKEQISVMSPEHYMEEGEMERASLQNLPLTDVVNQEHKLMMLPADRMDDYGVEPATSPNFPPTDVENKEEQNLMMSPAHHMEDGEVEPASSPSVSPTNVEIDNQEASGVVNPAVTDTERREEAEMDMCESGVNGVTGDNPDISARLEENEITGAESTDQVDGCIIPASNCMQSTSLELQCDKSLQEGQHQPVDNMDALSDRALLLQVLEENRKLKDVVGKVLQWGKQQSDVIHDLTHRIAQLEEHQPPTKLLHGEDDNGRKRITNGVCPVNNTGRSRRRLEKGRRNKYQLGFVDSGDWLSAESDEYF